MLDLFRRKKLEKRGLSCGKTRKRVNSRLFDNEVFNTPYARFSLVAVFYVALLYVFFKQTELLKSNNIFNDVLSGGNVYFSHAQIIFTSLTIILFLIIYLKYEIYSIYRQTRKLALILTAVFMQIIIVRIVILSIVKLSPNTEFIFFVITPTAFGTMVALVTLGKRAGVFVSAASALLCGLLLPTQLAFGYMIITLITGVTISFLFKHIAKRKTLVKSGFYAGVITSAMYIILGFLGQRFSEPLNLFDNDTIKSLSWLSICIGTTIFTGVITAILVNGLTPLIEWFFGITSDISWLEYSDLNQPLLRRLMLEAPGTYHHSLMVANLSEAAAESIKANSIMTRVCAYFHDIGKLKKPEYYIENQGEEINPHDELTPRMSAIVIKAHIKDGIDYAIRNHLPQQVIDAISQHHGTTLIYFFYKKALDDIELKKQQAKAGKINTDDIPIINEKEFCHDGPIPQSKECAIISLADAVESASRTIDKPSPNKIANLIDSIVKSRLESGQLDDSKLSITDLKVIKKSFQETIMSTLHRRINYPGGLEKNDKNSKAESKHVNKD